MATVTPNFNWPVPTSTDLVKDGATAIEALGDSIDASLVDLKGGTTGQVLAKASGTDMDFSWVAQDDSNAIQNTIVDAKGDLIAASAADTPARLAVGNNGETLVADSSTSTGLRYQATMAAGKNAIINGNFDIWQRGTSIVNPVNQYTADRWQGNSGETQTISRQSTGAPAGSQYYMRHTATQAACFFVPTTFLETSTVAALWGKTVTASILVRRNATMNTNLTFSIDKSSTVDAGSGASWTTISSTTITNASMPTATGVTDWFLATVTGTVPNDGTANGLRIRLLSGGAANGSTFDMSQCQLEVGSVATQFTRAGGTIQGELAACQRYYYRITGTLCVVASSGYTYSTTNGLCFMYLPVSMRVVPHTFDYLNIAAVDFTNATLTTTAIGNGGSSTPAILTIDVVVSGATSGRTFYLRGTNSNSYFGFSAEL
jgi:hypothetical protein